MTAPRLALCAVFGFVLAATAAEPAPPPKTSDATTLKVSGPLGGTVEVGRKCVLTVETTAKKVSWIVPAGCDSLAIDGKRLAVWAPPSPLDAANKPIPYVFLAQVPSGDDVVSQKYELVVLGPRPPPVPPQPVPPVPPPQPPTPAPTGFRVIFVYETSAPMTPAMQQVMFGEQVRKYLDTHAVKFGNVPGYRRWDKDVDAKNEKDPDIKALWEAAKVKIPNPFVPVMVVAVGGKADILSFPTSEADALATLQKYGGP